ncbi:hypothetical protein [Photobacterium profundum]|uniref:hypothetical protein n=1 Tax=Photobacterium profundum TaxID=74109 RepID=UPI00030BFC01|nr:hypothetical protein [Photobacterium profundum]
MSKVDNMLEYIGEDLPTCKRAYKLKVAKNALVKLSLKSSGYTEKEVTLQGNKKQMAWVQAN